MLIPVMLQSEFNSRSRNTAPGLCSQRRNANLDNMIGRVDCFGLIHEDVYALVLSNAHLTGPRTYQLGGSVIEQYAMQAIATWETRGSYFNHTDSR